MRKLVSIGLGATMLLSTTSVAFADDVAPANEGALPAADPAQAQAQTVVIPGMGTLTATQAILYAALIAAGVAAVAAFATASSSSSGTV